MQRQTFILCITYLSVFKVLFYGNKSILCTLCNTKSACMVTYDFQECVNATICHIIQYVKTFVLPWRAMNVNVNCLYEFFLTIWWYPSNLASILHIKLIFGCLSNNLKLHSLLNCSLCILLIELHLCVWKSLLKRVCIYICIHVGSM